MLSFVLNKNDWQTSAKETRQIRQGYRSSSSMGRNDHHQKSNKLVLIVFEGTSTYVKKR